MSHWTNAIIGERMAVDQQFSDRVAASQFSTAEWDLIMTSPAVANSNRAAVYSVRLSGRSDSVVKEAMRMPSTPRN